MHERKSVLCLAVGTLQALDPEQIGEVGEVSLGQRSTSPLYHRLTWEACVWLTVVVTSQGRLNAYTTFRIRICMWTIYHVNLVGRLLR